MRVVVTGASGNAGMSLLRALADDSDVDEIVGPARRRPVKSRPSPSSTRAREILGWEPRDSSIEAIRHVLAGIADAAGEPTPPLESARH